MLLRAPAACALSALLALGLGALSGCGAPSADSDDDTAVNRSEALVSGATIASIALANVGHDACGANSQGGAGYDSSCNGNGGQPEYWCADFARWVWGAAGVGDLGGLSAAAGSFYVYGQNHGTLSNTPHVGDAVVFDYQGGGVADHVAIVTQVNGNGTIESASGDWAGQSGSEAHFSSTSHVDLNAPAYPGVVGSHPGVIGMTISGFISPAGGSAAPSGPTACSVGGASGTCIDTGACAGKGGYHSTAGYCPGAANIECCTPDPTPPPATACSVDGVEGTCIDTGACAGEGGHHSTAGYCPGAANIECCTPDAAPPPPPPPPPPPAGCGELEPGQSLVAGQEKSSCDGVYTLAMQTDGNLVLYHNGKGALWATGTDGKGGHTAIMQTDGNFVLYDANGVALWNSHTEGHGGAFCAVQTDGNLVVYAPGSVPVWASGTNGK